MLETPHVAVGAAIALKIPNPLISIPLAFASHFVLDRVPHWNPHFYTETQKLGSPGKKSTTIAIVDSSLALAMGTAFALTALPDWRRVAVVLACCFASVISDQVKIPFFFFKQRTGFYKKWVDFERALQVEVSFIPGVLTQLVVISTAFFWIFS
ncbi:MAG: hypothetical protein Q8P91_02620 [bacterium]|nr:hypothetical protein [bacterium]